MAARPPRHETRRPRGKAAAAWAGGAYRKVREHGKGARTPLAAFFKTSDMGRESKLDPGQVVDTLGELIASLAAFAAKVPAKSMIALPGGLRPSPESVEAYENTVYRFRDRVGATYKPLPALFVESLEAFEAGKVIDAVPILLQCVERLVELHNENTITFTPPQQQRLRDYHRRLEKLIPESTQSELDLPAPETY